MVAQRQCKGGKEGKKSFRRQASARGVTSAVLSKQGEGGLLTFDDGTPCPQIKHSVDPMDCYRVSFQLYFDDKPTRANDPESTPAVPKPIELPIAAIEAKWLVAPKINGRNGRSKAQRSEAANAGHARRTEAEWQATVAKRRQTLAANGEQTFADPGIEHQIRKINDVYGDEDDDDGDDDVYVNGDVVSTEPRADWPEQYALYCPNGIHYTRYWRSELDFEVWMLGNFSWKIKNQAFLCGGCKEQKLKPRYRVDKKPE